MNCRDMAADIKWCWHAIVRNAFVVGGHWQGIAKSCCLKYLSIEHNVIGDDLVEGMFNLVDRSLCLYCYFCAYSVKILVNNNWN